MHHLLVKYSRQQGKECNNLNNTKIIDTDMCKNKEFMKFIKSVDFIYFFIIVLLLLLF